MKIKNILVPTDFSDRAAAALDVAVNIARQVGAEVSLLHVIEVPNADGSNDPIAMSSTPGNSNDLVPYMMGHIKYAKSKFEEIKNQYTDIKINENVIFDRVHRHIFKYVQENATDLVVIGSNGSTGMEEIVVGSNTEKVIRHLTVPVLVVKKNVKNFNPRNIVLASDFETPISNAVEFLKTFQKAFGATIHLVKIITPNNFEISSATKKKMQDFAKQNGIEDYTINFYNFYTEEEGIITFGEDIEADIISLVTHGRTGIARFLMGSIAENIANHSHTNVLTFRMES